MKTLFRFILPIFVVACLFSEAPLKGRLENGMTYYIHKNTYPKDSVNIRLVVKAGSLNENEDERGLAHFVEHMVFRGTTNFRDYEIKEFVDSMGGKFGHHSNAFTSFDTTEYFLNLPKASSENLSVGLKILNEMMFEAKFDEDLLEKERGIVLSEKSMQNVDQVSYFEKVMQFYNLSHLKERLPIGKEDLIRTVTPERMRTFYERQYRAGKMAVIITGDIEPSETLKKVEAIFTKKLAPLMDAKRDRQPVNPQEIKLISHVDPKMGYNAVTLAKQLAVTKKNRFSDKLVKASILKEFCSQHITKNLQLMQKDGRAYLNAGLMLAPYSNDSLLHFFNFCVKDCAILQATKEFHSDLNEILTSTVCQEILNVFLEAKIHACEKQIQNDHLVTNASWVNLFRDDFVFSRGIRSFADQNRALVRLAKSCTSNEVQELLLKIKKNFDTANYVTLTTTSEATCSLGELKETVKQARLEKQSASKQVRELKDLQVEKIKAQESRIAWKEQNSGCFEATLKNGLKLIFHPISEQKGAAQFCLLGGSGCNTLTNTELANAKFAMSVAADSGVANLDQHDFSIYLQKKGIALGACYGGCCGVAAPYQMGILQKFIRGSFKSESLSDSMKVLFAIFNHKQFDQKSFDCAVSNAKSMEDSTKDNEAIAFQKWMTKVMFGDHCLFQTYKAGSADYETAKKIYEEAFLNPSEFTLIISGDLEKDNLDSSLLEYISPLKDKASSKVEIQSTDDLEQALGEHTFCHTSKQGSYGLMCLPMKNASYTYKRMLELDLLSKIVSERLFQALRFDEAKSYSQAAMFVPSAVKLDQLSLMLFFIADDEHVAAMHDKSIGVLNELCVNGISADELKAAKSKVFEEIRIQEQAPFRFIALHEQRVTHGFSQDDLMNRKIMIENQISSANIEALIKELDTGKHLKISKILG